MKNILVLQLVATVLAPVVYIACGSSGDAEVAPAGDGGPETSIVPGGDGGTNNNTGTDGAVANPPDTGTPTPDASSTRDGGTTSDAGPGGNTTSLTCGAATCTIPGQTCCATLTNQSTFTFACEPGAACPGADAGGNGPIPVGLACASAANCASGEVCCIVLDNNDVMTSACRTEAVCANSTGASAVLCDPATPSVGCPVGAPCSSDKIDDWDLPNGFGTCGGQGN